MFTATFVVDRLPRQVWDALELPVQSEGPVYVEALDGEVILYERDPERLVRYGLKGNSALSVQLRFEPVTAAGWPTRVVVDVQTADLAAPAAEAAAWRWRHFTADLQLWLTHGVRAPRLDRLESGVAVSETGFGLEIVEVAASSPFAACGLESGDTLIAVRGVRVLTRDALRAVLARDSEVPGEVVWVRGGELQRATLVMTGGGA